ncbi:hypothetical protein HanPI659440_Chr16g0627091 [Helianthus annuus]|nr:hypothetical protein HanPI659440_Chr16g0627091 [Helianthus annuus]
MISETETSLRKMRALSYSPEMLLQRSLNIYSISLGRKMKGSSSSGVYRNLKVSIDGRFQRYLVPSGGINHLMDDVPIILRQDWLHQGHHQDVQPLVKKVDLPKAIFQG